MRNWKSVCFHQYKNSTNCFLSDKHLANLFSNFKFWFEILFNPVITMVNDPADWLECKSLATSKVSPSGLALHHASFRPSHLDSPKKTWKKTEWRRYGWSHSDAQVSDGITQNLREKSLNSRNHAKSLSAYSSVLKSVKKCSKRAYLRSSLEFLIYLCIFSLLTVTPLDTWLASSCTRVTIWNVPYLSVTSNLQAVRLSYPGKE